MSAAPDPSADVTPGWDPLIAELQAQRERVGSPSYGEIAARIQEDRRAKGAPDYSARIARSTVYDAFRLGRSRVNLALVREIGQALGAEPAHIEEWIRSSTESGAPGEPEPDATRATVIVFFLACLALNMVGRVFVDFFALPIYLDMVGTAIAAIVLGPWRGAALGLTTNLVGIIGSGWASLPFALVNVAGALVWGYGVRKWGLGRTLPRFFGLNVAVALVCSVVAVPILAFMIGDTLRVGHDSVTEIVKETISAYWVALPLSNIMTSTWDKLISGFVALVVISALPVALRRGVPLVLADARD